MLRLFVKIAAFSLLQYRSQANDVSIRLLGATNQPIVDCEMQTIMVRRSVDEQHTKYHKCMTFPDEEQDGAEEMVYTLPEWIQEKYQDQFNSYPKSYLRIHGAHAERNTHIHTSDWRGARHNDAHQDTTSSEDKIVVDDYDHVAVEVSPTPFHSMQEHRTLATSSGTSTVLFVRVTTSDASAPVSANIISQRVFGSSGTPKAVFNDCSFGQLQLEPALGEGVHNGVTELHVEADIVGADIFALENLLVESLTTKVGSLSSFDHVGFCVPTGSTLKGEDWLAYAQVGRRRSFYNGKNCEYLSNLNHELAHNMGLGHAGEGSVAYGDQSGVMGYGYARVNYPIMCFNAAKNAQLGWYGSKMSDLNILTGPWNGRLYGYVDFDRSPGLVLLKIGDVYIQYNKISTINRDTMERRDEIAVVQSDSVWGARSNAYPGLNVHNSLLTIPDFSSGKALHIEVCDHVESSNGLAYYHLSIRLSDQISTCDQTTQTTTTVAVSVPTNLPAISPTPAPLQPTSSPSSRSTTMPTQLSTPFPTGIPSSPPSLSPSVLPSEKPISRTPTVAPTQSTRSPSSAPSESPSYSMTPTFRPLPPSESPSASPSSDICDDNHHATFYVNEEEGYQACIWLQARPEWQEDLCSDSSGSSARSLCEETCGVCTDNCEDTDGTFSHHGVDRPCSWLSIRAFVQELVCVPGETAWYVCPETCNVCDGSIL